MRETTTTYEPDNSLEKGYLYIFREIFDELKNSRWLTYQLFKRNFFVLYKQSFIGLFWIFLIPLFSVGMFIILNRAGIFSFGEINVPYPIYAILGLAFWQLFSAGLIASSNSLIEAGPMIAKINFSKKSLVIASTARSLISFLIQIVLVCILFFFYRFSPDIKILLVPLLAIPVMLLTLGLGFILSLINGIIRDIGNALSAMMMFLMFLTPVLYAKPMGGVLGYLTKYNMLYYLISFPRELALMGSISDWKGYLIASIISFVVFITCILAFHLTESRVTERI